MAYSINKTDGTLLATVADGQVDDLTTDITLIGKNYSGFGESLNELEEDAELGLCDMELIEKPEMPSYSQATNMAAPASFIDDSMFDDAEEQKRRAAERIQKLRNLSFNMSGGGAESGSEFDNVPAYVRRNMELFGSTLTTVEDFYSKYTVGKDEKDQTQISTLNTFLHGKKPD